MRGYGQVPFSILALLVMTAVHVNGQGQQPNPLRIVGPTRLTLDPVCNARAGVALVSRVRNDARDPVDLALSIGDLVSRPAGRLAAASVALTPPAEGAGREAQSRVSLAPRETIDVRVDVKGTLESGEWEIPLQNNGVVVGTLAIVSPQVAFGVTLDTPTPAAPALVFERGKPAIIPLKNGDPFSYLVSGRYSLRGFAHDLAEIPLPANSGGELTLTPRDEWFTPGMRLLFKDDIEDGRLTLRFSSASCPGDPAAPTRVITAKTTLNPWGGDDRSLRGNGLLLSTLLLGGVCSLALNFFIPAQSRRRTAKAQLAGVARRIDDLPGQGDPRVLNSVTVAKRQLEERLRRLKIYDAQFPAGMTEIEQGVTRLCARLDLAAQMELVLNRYWRQRCVIVSDEIEELRRQLIDLLKRAEPGNQDIAAAQALIRKLNDLVTSTAPNPELAARLAKGVVRLREQFDTAKGDVGVSPVWHTLRQKLGDGFDLVLGTSPMSDPAAIAPADYAPLARTVFTLAHVREFIMLCGVGHATGALSPEQSKDLHALLPDLRSGTWDSFKRVERRVRKLRDGVSHDDVEAEITDKRVHIETNRILVRQFEPTELRANFLSKRVQGSAARDEYTCHWLFEPSKIEATGWTVSYLFPAATEPEPQAADSDPGPLRRLWRSLRALVKSDSNNAPIDTAASPLSVVKVRFVRDDGFAVPGDISTRIRVRPPLVMKVRASFWTELLRLSLALGIAAFGLIVGAREQILKLDLLPALIAVFLLGFGSDRLKNLFSEPAPQPTPTATPTAAAEAPAGAPAGAAS
jgi:hypothetical protein